MAQAGNNDNRFGGPYLIQDSDHMSGINIESDSTQGDRARQSEQSESRTGQQGDTDSHTNRQQGGERRRQSY